MKQIIPLIVGSILATVSAAYGLTYFAIAVLFNSVVVFVAMLAVRSDENKDFNKLSQSLQQVSKKFDSQYQEVSKLKIGYNNLRQRIESFERRDQKINSPFGG